MQPEIPRVTLLPIGLMLIIVVQFALGRVAYFDQAMLGALYMLWAALLIMLGQRLRQEFGLPALAATLAAFLLLGAEMQAVLGVLQQAYDLLTQGKAPYSAPDALTGLQQAYTRDENDEFVKATVIGEPAAMQDGDVAVFMNFRADRARQLTRALTEPAFDSFRRERFPKLASFVTLSSYGEDFHLPSAYTPTSIHNCFGEYISGLGLQQLRIAETEKYAHVTYFMNGGREQPYPGEDRILVPSPKVATYDLKPEMSAYEVTDKLQAAIRSDQYQAIICNYANGDMVGHSGNLAAAVKAIEALDVCIGRVVGTMLECGGEVIITADHGNAEQMLDRDTQQAHTAHTLNPVPFLYIGRKARIADSGALQDVAPTLLAMMGLPKPPEMTGTPLITIQ